MSAMQASVPRRVLVAVDAESMSDHAIDAGLEFGKLFGAHVELVHAAASPVGVPAREMPVRGAARAPSGDVASDRASADRIRVVPSGADHARSAGEYVRAHVDDLLSAQKSALRAEDILRVEPGLPARVLLDAARQSKADLIVLGTLRRRPIVDFGSTARAILAKAPCAVFVQAMPRAAIRRILVAYDSSSESRIALETACAWARVLRARVHVLSCCNASVALAGTTWGGFVAADAVDLFVKETQRAFEREMAEFEWGGVEHVTTFEEGLPAERILAAAKSADMIAMGTHGRTGFAAALLGSVAYSVLKHATTPVLVVRDPSRAFQV